MQISSFSASASIQVTRSDVPKDPGALIAADVARQLVDQQPAQVRRHRDHDCDDRGDRGDRGRHLGHFKHDAEKAQHRMNRLARALDQVMAAQPNVSASANVLIAGDATAQGGVAVTIRAERVFGLYTDAGAGTGPWSAMGDAAFADRVSILADRVENVFTAGGSDAVSILARRVDGVSTGNDADSLSIVADQVRNILTDEQNPWGDRDAADAVAIAARLVERVATGGGDDAIAILGGTVSDIHAQDGNDALSIVADLISGIHGGAGDDAISIETVIGRRQFDDLLDLTALNPAEDVTPAARMLSAVSWGLHVDGGAGNDAISIAAQSTLGVAGGTGDDAIALQGGTIGLFYAMGDGNDSVALGAGTEAVVQLAEDIGAYTIEMGEDSLTLRLGEGSITFTGLASSGAIGLRLGSGEVMQLHSGLVGTLDLTV